MSCLLRVSTPLKSNFKPLFSSRNRLRALSDTISLLAGRFHAGHKNAYRVHAHGSACTLVAGTQDVAFRLECYLPQLSGVNKVSLFRADILARYLLRCAQDSSVVAMDKTYLMELVRDMTPLWDQRDKNYHNRDLEPILWDEIGEKLNVAGNNNTNEIGYCLLIYIQYL